MQQDPLHWLLTQARTRDEHDPSIAAKPFPDKEYIRELVRLWLENKMLLVEKSRQMIVTWTFCALYLHDAQFTRNRLSFIQSKKEEDSDRLVQRCWFIYQNQDPFVRTAFPAEYTYCHLRFYDPEKRDGLPYSEIWGIPQGGDILRQHTGSALFIDEGGFQPDLEKSITAAQPMLKGGGRIDLVSSAEPGYFEMLAADMVR